MRKFLLAVALALIVASCGGTESDLNQTTAPAGDVATAPSDDSAPTSASATTGDDSPAGDNVTEADVTPSFDGPPAPDFELALSDGSNFSLSAEQKPVYVVFWAEW